MRVWSTAGLIGRVNAWPLRMLDLGRDSGRQCCTGLARLGGNCGTRSGDGWRRSVWLFGAHHVDRRRLHPIGRAGCYQKARHESGAERTTPNSCRYPHFTLHSMLTRDGRSFRTSPVQAHFAICFSSSSWWVPFTSTGSGRSRRGQNSNSGNSRRRQRIGSPPLGEPATAAVLRNADRWPYP
jgi:hypothetical protein